VANDDSLISWTALNMHDDTFIRVRQFQFVQHRPGEATLRIVPAHDFTDADGKRIQRNLEQKLTGRIKFEVQLTDEIPLTASGKSTYVEQHVDLQRLVSEKGVPV